VNGIPDERKLQLTDVTIGVVTALPEEYAAAKQILGCDHEVTAPGKGSGRTFVIGQIRARGGGQHVVALAPLPDMGNNMAAIAATKLLQHCSGADHIIMCGIAGAVPNPDEPEDHVRLGDIVVSGRQGVMQYDLDKETPEVTEIRNPPRPPSAELLEAVRHLQANEQLGERPWEQFIEGFLANRRDWKRPPPRYDRLKDWDDEPKPSHPVQPRRKGKPLVFCGPIGSANKLLKNPTKRNRLRDQYGLKAVEMEGSGIADATWSEGAGYLVVRGTCDYCNPDKG
jgi:nucleoside phosphorylase